jgi:hypothetical protein
MSKFNIGDRVILFRPQHVSLGTVTEAQSSQWYRVQLDDNRGHVHCHEEEIQAGEPHAKPKDALKP